MSSDLENGCQDRVVKQGFGDFFVLDSSFQLLYFSVNSW